MSILTHLDAEGRARMVDVSHKALTRRRAVATGLLRCAPETLTLVREGRAPKGAVVSTAESSASFSSTPMSTCATR